MSKKIQGNTYDSINFLKYNLPKEHKIIHAENVFSTLEQWPSFSTSRNTPVNQILLQKKRLVVLDEPHSKMPNNVPKPKFLNHLDEYVTDQFKKHGIKGNERNPVRLQIYREVFDWIIEAFKTYQPLLSKIKREYELNLSFLGDEIRRLEPMKELLWTIAEDRDQQVLKLKQKENLEILQLKQEKDNLIKKVTEFESNMSTLQCQIDKLYENLGNEHIGYRKEADSKKLLIIDINELKAQLEDLSLMKKDQHIEEIEDAIMLRYALEEAKKAQALAVKQYSEMKAVYADVVPMIKFQKLNDYYENLLLEQKIILEKLSISEKSLRTLDEKYNALIKQRDFYYFKYMELARSSPSITQPWDKFSDFVSSGVEKWQDVGNKEKGAEEVAQAIFEDIKDNQNIKKIGSLTGKADSEDSLSNDDKDEALKMRSKTSLLPPKSVHIVSDTENRAVMRTMIEMMCELPPGSINPNFDPLNLLHILNREKSKKDGSVKDSKSTKKKHNID